MEQQIVTRKEALDSGLTYYFTGKPCVRGHVVQRTAKRGSCILCDKERNKATNRPKEQRLRNQEIRRLKKQEIGKGFQVPLYEAVFIRKYIEEENIPMDYHKALETKRLYYMPLEACKKGHISPIGVLGRVCFECSKDYRKPKDLTCEDAREKSREYMRNYKANNILRVRKSQLRYSIARSHRNRLATPSWLTKEHYDMIESLYIQSRELSISTGEQYQVDHIVPLKGKTVSGLHVPWNLRVIPAKENAMKNNKLIESEL